jgi:tetratricopeptide (TPR) repeat protein
VGDVIQFPTDAQSRVGFEPVRSTYSAEEIGQQFGLSERTIRGWTDEGLIETAPPSEDSDDSYADEVRYGFRALTQFRRVRELRNRGRTLKQIDAELRGQMNLFEPRGQLLRLPVRLSPFEQALQLHERNDAGAVDAYRRAIDEEDYVADAYCNLGILVFESGDVTDSFSCFTTALQHDPRHFESHFNLAYVYFETGALRLARLHYELAEEIEPNFANLHFNVGLVHAMNGDLQRAAEALSRARELAPDDEELAVEDLLANIQRVIQATNH